MRKIWFKRKLYGWGWYPCSWQGWLVTLGYVLSLIVLSTTLYGNPTPSEIAFMYILPFMILSALLIRIGYKKGEKPRWQWGRRRNK